MPTFQLFQAEMPNQAKTHLDMLQLCCGICGEKKNPKILSPITEYILNQIKAIDGYQNYDLNDDRYPKVICQKDRGAVREKVKNPFKVSYKFNLPSIIPRFNQIPLPFSATRTSPSGFNDTHTCFLCEQNHVGRPKIHHEADDKSSKVCPKCFQKTGRGISHPCVKSTKRSVDIISDKIQEMNPLVQDKLCYSLLKSKVKRDSTNSNFIKLRNSGTPVTIQMNPSTSSKMATIKTETLDNIRVKGGLTLNQMKIVQGGIRADLGRNSLPPNYRHHASSQIHVLDNFYKSERHIFITATQMGAATEYTKMWTVFAPIVPLIEWINNYRNNNDSSEYLIKVMADSGRGKTKVCFCIIPTNESIPTKSRSTYAQGGVLAKCSLNSGVDKSILCFASPDMKEVNWNLKKIFELIGLYQLLTEYSNVIFTGDLKLLNEVYGIMEASCKHPCLYCTAESQELQPGLPRTIKSLRDDFEQWDKAGCIKNECKNFNNVQNYPLFKTLPVETPTLKITPPPALHILIGIFNHIWKGITDLSEHHEEVCHQFALKYNCVRESYHGKTFEGNECTKLMSKIISGEDSSLTNLSNTEHHIEAIKKFNILRKQVFGLHLEAGWNQSLNDFMFAYKKIPNITKPLKVHILVAHLAEFIEKYGNNKGLGFYSEQTGEAVHQKFETIFAKYCIKNISSDQYGHNLLKAVVEFSSSHI